MRVSVGYSDNPDTGIAGAQAAVSALAQAGQRRPCDLLLLFASIRHDQRRLREAVASVAGLSAPIVGGGSAGAISNASFGYAGDQVILAAFWFENVRCDFLYEGDLDAGEEPAGERLGGRLSALGVTPASPVILFYDAVASGHDSGPRLLMATPLLRGLERALGFLPDVVGAGLVSDIHFSPSWQWTGRELQRHTAMALTFSGDIKMDTVIMHGCRPATGYYTVTKADGRLILEIDGQPALQFVDRILNGRLTPEECAFLLILGVHSGDKWGTFKESDYASRLCLGVDRERGGLVMFEPDMTAGTEFQIMNRSLDLDYIAVKVAEIFGRLGGRRPVFATYWNCLGRAAGYSGLDKEDAAALQNAVGARVPLLGLYTGVEIAPVNGRSRSLDWTGVLSLFSVPA